jgi:hypothetical protein
MLAASFFISPHDLWALLGSAAAPQIVDVCRRDVLESSPALAGDDDHGMLRQGFIVYDALFAWLRFAAEERHNWPAKAA